MQKMEIDGRTKEDILSYIEKAAENYTPEWRFNRENKDPGTALAYIYADMFSETIKQFNKVLLKNRNSFFNSIGANLLPAVPAGGYAVFSLVNDSVCGAEIESGMAVSADTKDGEVSYETVDDLYVTPSALACIYQTSDASDTIYSLYDAKEGITAPIRLFDRQEKNLQCHKLYMGHNTLLSITGEAWITISFYIRPGITMPKELLQVFADPAYAIFEYYSQEGYKRLNAVAGDNGALLFHKKKDDPPFEKTKIGKKELCFIRCTLLEIKPFQQFSFTYCYLSARGGSIEPDVINGNGIDCNLIEYMPFGERPGLYDEVYFASRETLLKAGSRVELSFSMEFMRTALTDTAEEGVEWNWVMKKSDFKVDQEFDLTIEEVIWEYYNGNGWCRLFPDGSYKDIFSTKDGIREQYLVISFICPEDMTPVLIHSCESCYIRARITKIRNLYKTKGYYVVPVLSDTAFSYQYLPEDKNAAVILTENNMERGECKEACVPFRQTGVKEEAVYMGFTKPLAEGPVKILFSLLEHITGTHPALRWEYSGTKGFTELNVADETENFSKTGLVTIMGSSDFKSARLFGREQYWIRVLDENGYYKSPIQRTFPSITGIHMNAGKIINTDLTKTEYFFTQRYEENKTIMLLHGNIIDLSVWVDEGKLLSWQQIEDLKKEREVECIYDESGLLERVWVRWEEKESFVGTKSSSRCFVADKIEGSIYFGNGRYGRIIPADKKENIKVVYKCGGGERTNLPAGAVSKMKHTVGYVNRVTNPYPLKGGCNHEMLEESVNRNAKRFIHHEKAVTPADYEELAKNASRNIKKARCFSGLNEKGERCSGAVTLVVLQKDYKDGRFVFLDMKETLLSCMAGNGNERLLLQKKFFIREPIFLEICIRAELAAGGLCGIFKIKKEAEERLAAFLNPLTGASGGKGWDIGMCPTNIQIQNILKKVDGVNYIKNVFMTGYIEGSTGKKEMDLEKVREHPYIIPISGRHEIVIRMEQEG